MNKNASILKKIKKDASPKVPPHRSSYYFPNKSHSESEMEHEVFNEDLKIVIETSKDDYALY
jgi:hypothetical protein